MQWKSSPNYPKLLRIFGNLSFEFGTKPLVKRWLVYLQNAVRNQSQNLFNLSGSTLSNRPHRRSWTVVSLDAGRYASQIRPMPTAPSDNCRKWYQRHLQLTRRLSSSSWRALRATCSAVSLSAFSFADFAAFSCIFRFSCLALWIWECNKNMDARSGGFRVT